MKSYPKRRENRAKGQSVRSRPWLEDEERMIQEYVANFSAGKWSKCAKILNAQYYEGAYVRSARQIREHWNNKLNPTLRKEPWTPEED